MTRTYLITGGGGNLACRLTFELADAERIILFDRADGPVTAVRAGCQYVRGDLSRPEEVLQLLREHRPQVVVHLASLLSGACEQDRRAAVRVNIDGFFELLEACLETGVGQVFFTSTLASYGSPRPDPLPEDFPQWPAGMYGATKVACERLGAYYRQRHGLDFRCIRVPMVLSEFASAGAASAYASRAFVDSVRSGRFVFKVQPSTRVSAIYVKDCVRAIVGLVQAPAEQLTRHFYNIFALAPTAQEIADAIKARLPGVNLSFDADPLVTALAESWPAGIVDDTARRDWGWKPAYDLDRLADDFLADLRRSSKAAD